MYHSKNAGSGPAECDRAQLYAQTNTKSSESGAKVVSTQNRTGNLLCVRQMS